MQQSSLRGAVGTRISPRPLHRSRRALLTHRAPPSDQTCAMNDLVTFVARRAAFGSTRYFGSVSEPRPPNGCSPWVRPFPPRLPPGVASPCSVASQVPRLHPTSHPRTCSACGSSPCRHRLPEQGHRPRSLVQDFIADNAHDCGRSQAPGCQDRLHLGTRHLRVRDEPSSHVHMIMPGGDIA